jgi:hypothetical protein
LYFINSFLCEGFFMNSLRTVLHGIVVMAVVGGSSVSAQHMVPHVVNHIAKDVWKGGLTLTSFVAPSIVANASQKAPLLSAALTATGIAYLGGDCGDHKLTSLAMVGGLLTYSATNYGMRRFEKFILNTKSVKTIITDLENKGFLPKSSPINNKLTESAKENSEIGTGSQPDRFTGAVKFFLVNLRGLWDFGINNIVYGSISKHISLAAMVAALNFMHK